MSGFFSILFLGGYLIPSFGFIDHYILIWLEPFALGLKICIILFIFIWVRATFPRLRFDQLITLCWCSLLPITLAFFFLIPSVLITFSFNSPPPLALDASSGTG